METKDVSYLWNREIIRMRLSGLLIFSWLVFLNPAFTQSISDLLEEQTRLHNAQEYQQSIDIGEQLLKNWSSYPDANNRLKTEVQYLICQSNGSLQRYEVALQKCREYQQSVQQIFGDRSAEFFESKFLLILLRQLKGDTDGLIEAYQQLIAEKDLYPEEISNTLGLMYSKMGAFSLTNNELEKALAHYELAEKYWLEAGNCRDIAAIYENIAAFYQKRGWMEKALVFFNKALSIYYEEGNIWPGIFSNMALTYSNAGKKEKAVEFNLLAISTPGMNLNDQVTTYNNLGGNYLDLKEYAKAEEAFKTALRIGQTFDIRFGGRAITHVKLASATWFLGNYKEAYQMWENILKEAKQEENFLITIFAAAEWAKGLEREGKYREALQVWAKGYPALVNNYELVLDSSTAALPKPQEGANIYVARYWVLRGDYLLKLFEKEGGKEPDLLNLAESAYLYAQEVVFSLLESRMGNQFFYYIYEGAHLGLLNVLFLKEDSDLGDAFLYSEQLRQVRSMMELSEVKKLRTDPSEGIRAQIQSLKQQIVRVQERAHFQGLKMASSADSSSYFKLRDSLFVLHDQLENFSAQLKIKEAGGKVISVNRVSLSELQSQILKDGEMLIEYSMGDSLGFVLAISRDHSQLLRFSTSAVETLVKSYRNQVRKSFQSPANVQLANELIETSYLLFEQLLEPILDDSKFTSISTLKIIPDGILSYLPFEALIVNPVNPSRDQVPDFSSLPYLIHHYQVSYLNSVGLFKELNEWPRSKAVKTIGAFAADYDTSDNKEGFIAQREVQGINQRAGNLDLPGARKEVIAIQKVMRSGEYFLATTESMFKEKAPQYQIIHLALHAIVNEEAPLYSQFLFTEDRDSIEENGHLNASELYEMDLKADLAFLSACNSGSGSFDRGRGVQSLARALNFSGVPSVVMSLWQLPDAPTAAMVPSFYKSLKRGVPLDKSLQNAKLKYIKKSTHSLQAHPFNWAGLQLVGATDPIAIQGTATNKLWPFFVVGLLVVGFILIRRARS